MKDFKDFLKELISIVLIAFVLAMVLRAFVIEAREIPTGSMLPTIQLKDRVMVVKFIYHFKDPARGDIIVFKAPPGVADNEDLIKRVIGLPGETVEVRDGKVWINGKALNEPYLAEPPMYQYGPVKVPEGCYFMMGDNRNRSYDSHLWNVWLTRDHIEGKAILKYWPPQHFTLLEREVTFDENTADE